MKVTNHPKVKYFPQGSSHVNTTLETKYLLTCEDE